MILLWDHTSMHLFPLPEVKLELVVYVFLLQFWDQSPAEDFFWQAGRYLRQFIFT